MPAGRLGVVLGKVERVAQQEGVEARGRAGGLIARIDVDERILRIGDAELLVDVVGLEGRANDALAEGGDGLGCDPDAGFIGGGQEERPQERTVDTLAEGQPSRAHRGGERGREPRRQFLVRPEQRVPIGDDIHIRPFTDQGRPGAPVKPEAGPMPSISSHRGQHCAG